MLGDGEIHALVEKELAELNERRKRDGFPPTSWLGDLDPYEVTQIQLSYTINQLKELLGG